MADCWSRYLSLAWNTQLTGSLTTLTTMTVLQYASWGSVVGTLDLRPDGDSSPSVGVCVICRHLDVQNCGLSSTFPAGMSLLTTLMYVCGCGESTAVPLNRLQ